MRTLTFAGFLTRYVHELSFAGTNSLSKLADEAAYNNPRLRAPLFLYALFCDKGDVLLRAVKSDGLRGNYEQLLTAYDKQSMASALQHNNDLLPAEYKKVWRSYVSQRDRLLADNDTKELMRQKILRLQAACGVSNYRIYTALKLNPGNLNAWLKYGDSTKVSLATARKALEFLEDRLYS